METIKEMLQRSASVGPLITTGGSEIYLPDDPRLKGYLIKSEGRGESAAINNIGDDTIFYIDRKTLGGNSGQKVLFTATKGNNLSLVVNAGTGIDQFYRQLFAEHLQLEPDKQSAANMAYSAVLNTVAAISINPFIKLIDRARENLTRGLAIDGHGANLALANEGINNLDPVPLTGGFGDRMHLKPEVEAITRGLTDFLPIGHLKFIAPGDYDTTKKNITEKILGAAAISLDAAPVVEVRPGTELRQMGILKASLSTETLSKWVSLVEKLRGIEPVR